MSHSMDNDNLLGSHERNPTTTACFVQAYPISRCGLACFGLFKGKEARLAPRNLFPFPKKRARLEAVRMMQGNENDSSQGDKKDGGNSDWDESWKTFQEGRKSEGGVFQLPPETSEEKQRKFEGERVEKLTTAWSNESGFLVGIGVIGVIALFYAYVFATGGISR